MDKAARQNSEWQGRVKALLREGWGCEDIADETERPLAVVKAEIRILKESGELKKIYLEPPQYKNPLIYKKDDEQE